MNYKKLQEILNSEGDPVADRLKKKKLKEKRFIPQYVKRNGPCERYFDPLLKKEKTSENPS